jgi:two-component system OmpR family response regulator
MKILLVEDDLETAAHISQGLIEAEHTIVVANDGQTGLTQANTGAWDLLIVDRMLPRLDGLSLVRSLRKDGNESPVLFLTTLGGIDDRVCGLEAGGDDYLLKPFAFAELIARINALGRRRRPQQETIVCVRDIKIDLVSRVVCRAERTIELLPQEYRLLEYMMRNAGRVITRTMLLEDVWDLHFDPGTNIVESHISRLRSKLDDSSDPRLISTIRSAGYILNVS